VLNLWGNSHGLNEQCTYFTFTLDNSSGSTLMKCSVSVAQTSVCNFFSLVLITYKQT